MDDWKRLYQDVITCRQCPRLVQHREHVGQVKRRAYRDETYWARPIPGWGDPQARLLIVGLAPAAHGGNRTGRIFTGDASGNFLMAALHWTGFANQPYSLHRNDGLVLRDVYITAVVRCVPPGNRPRPDELRNCRAFLMRELELLHRVRVVLTLGQVATQGFLAAWSAWRSLPRPLRVRFRHGGQCALDETHTLLMSYHPSRQNTQTGRLTRAMLVAVLEAARDLLGSEGSGVRLSQTLDP
ncbi:MAG: uracil-DNA glycosylase [Acidobacteria bacterium]|nr:uracil-DNA glycosylase [Acidobacteriota bacterium]MDW7984144.1 uracil-DNA glycosylase [Acidobacteriota bacterium]